MAKRSAAAGRAAAPSGAAQERHACVKRRARARARHACVRRRASYQEAPPPARPGPPGPPLCCVTCGGRKLLKLRVVFIPTVAHTALKE
mgnify:CR=1 FL=1